MADQDQQNKTVETPQQLAEEVANVDRAQLSKFITVKHLYAKEVKPFPGNVEDARGLCLHL